MGLIHYPRLIHVNANARNGMSPSAYMHRQLVDAENHITAYRHRPVWARSWELGLTNPSGSSTIARFRFRTGYGVSSVAAYIVLGSVDAGGVFVQPYVYVDLTISGGATTTLGPVLSPITEAAFTDAPDEWQTALLVGAVTENTVYECALRVTGYPVTGSTAADAGRVRAVCVYELGTSTVSESTNYMNTHSPVAGSPIYDADRDRLLVGLSNMHTRNGGICWSWSLLDGAARTRSSATFINLVDNSETGTPTTASYGVYLDGQYHNRRRATTVPVQLGVYASMSSGTGTVRIIDTAGNTYCSTSVNSASPGWFTATGSLPTAETFYALQYAGDGANTLSVYGTSLIETG